ncbi:MAG TPA: PDZ domain-containing protein, partial [Caulobacteraceae bacterium]|nr:PDZ domain-containing protein [Caulobacteraceae bacterium]
TPHPSVLGMALGALDETTRRHINAPPELKGVVIEGVDQSSDAGQKGLHRGDVIVQAGGHPVTTAAEVASAVESAKKAGRSGVLLGIFRQGRTTFLPIKVAG